MPLARKDVEEIIAGILEIGIDEVVPNAEIISDLGGDSLALVSIVDAIDEVYGIKIDFDLENLNPLKNKGKNFVKITVKEIAGFVYAN